MSRVLCHPKNSLIVVVVALCSKDDQQCPTSEQFGENYGLRQYFDGKLILEPCQLSIGLIQYFVAGSCCL